MRTIKEYLNENFFGNLGIGKKQNIEGWLKKYNIKYYTINDDFTIDIEGNVNLCKYSEKELPGYIQFNIIKGHFNISSSNIITLKGVPKKCEKFYCNDCL